MRRVGFLFLCLPAAAVLATDYTWSNGAGTMTWADAGNWSPEGVPGTGDTVKFTNAGIAANSTIAMDGDRTVKSFNFEGTVPSFTLGEPTSTLTMEAPSNTGGYSNGKPIITLAANLHLIQTLTLTSVGGWERQFVFAGDIFDDGLGYGFTTTEDQNQDYAFTYPVSYTGPTELRAHSVFVKGPDGAFRNSPITFNGRAYNPPTLKLDNEAAANSNRLPDNLPLTFRSNISRLEFIGNASTPVEEHIGGLVLESGAHTFVMKHKGAKLDLVLDGNLERSGAAVLLFEDTDTSSKRIVIPGAVDNGHGIYQPWILRGNWNLSHATVDANGALKGASYTDLPMSSDANPDKLYTASADLTLTRDQSVYGLRFNAGSDGANTLHTADLGSHVLTVGEAGIAFTSAGSRLVTASGTGSLHFTGPSVMLFAYLNNWPADSGTVTIDAPISSDSETPPELCIPYFESTKGIRLLGEDRIGVYSNVLVNAGTTEGGNNVFEVGGPSDRTFLGIYSGHHMLVKSGAGTLTLDCETPRIGSTCKTLVQEGRLVVASPHALACGSSDKVTVTNNAILQVSCDVESFCAQFFEGAKLTGTGDIHARDVVKFKSGSIIAPGNDGIGTLAIDRTLFSEGATYEWEIGDGTDVPGVDYDLFSVPRTNSGGFKFENHPTVKLAIRAAGSGYERVKGKTFTIATWTPDGDISVPSAVEIVNLSPRKLNTDNASVVFDTKSKKVYLSGLLAMPSGTVIMVQ